MRRVNIKAILANPVQRRELCVRCIIATQAREGITTTREQAEQAYDKYSMGYALHINWYSGPDPGFLTVI